MFLLKELQIQYQIIRLLFSRTEQLINNKETFKKPKRFLIHDSRLYLFFPKHIFAYFDLISTFSIVLNPSKVIFYYLLCNGFLLVVQYFCSY
jgi:hypothetical protein